MKKAVYLFAFLAFAGITFMTSCGGGDDDDDVSPTISFTGGAGYTSVDATMTVGATFTVGITASKNASSGKKLAGFTVVSTFNNVPATEVDSTIDTDNFSWEADFTANTAEGVERWTFTITDKDGESTEISYNITTVSGSGPINSYTGITLGSWENVTGSFFASASGTVYTVSEANSNQSAVDFIYYYGSTNSASLAAPDDADVNTITTYGLSTWTDKNSTKFTAVLSGITWADVTDDAEIVSNVTSPTSSDINSLSANDIVGFETEAGKKGLIQIGSITAGSDGTITIEVKVQQ